MPGGSSVTLVMTMNESQVQRFI